MSEFKVDIRKVTEINEHPNAERLELVTVSNLKYTIISQKNTYQVGDFAVVFQSDSIIPKEMIEYFELSFLHKGERVKEVKLRGVVSQALLLPYAEVYKYSMFADKEMLQKKLEHFFLVDTENSELAETIDFSEELGVVKYEQPETFKSGNARGSLPIGVEKYDLENAERYSFYFDELLNHDVIITEKLEGTNIAIVLDYENQVHVCSRNLDLKNEGGTYWENANKYNLAERMIEIRELVKKIGSYNTDEQLILRGEIIGSGIQGNIYGMNLQDIYFFDIKYGANYVDFEVFRNVIEQSAMKIVPVVWRGVLNDFSSTFEKLKERSNGKSLLSDTLREGIVIKPIKEMMSGQGFTRLIFKQRSVEYLANTK